MIVYCTCIAHEHEVDFPGLHVDCDSAEEEDLEDTLPYEEPPPPYSGVIAAQGSSDLYLGVVVTQANLKRQDLQTNQTILHTDSNVPQVDGPLEGTEQYYSATASPTNWREYPINSTGTQVLNWNLAGDQLYQTQSSVGDIQRSNIAFEQDNNQNCRDSEHCTYRPYIASSYTDSETQDTQHSGDSYDKDEESYTIMDTHLRPPRDFFYIRYTQNFNDPQLGQVGQSLFQYNTQPDYIDCDLYAPNRGRDAASRGQRGARRGCGAQPLHRGGAQPQRGNAPNLGNRGGHCPGIPHRVVPAVPPPVPPPPVPCLTLEVNKKVEMHHHQAPQGPMGPRGGILPPGPQAGGQGGNQLPAPLEE